MSIQHAERVIVGSTHVAKHVEIGIARRDAQTDSRGMKMILIRL
jgi:hypothetical protein